jgi:3',5'-cyclic AMP phosphodiesterase CpdA
MLGALPVVADFCAKLRIREIVDGLCLVGDLAELAAPTGRNFPELCAFPRTAG